MKKFLGVLVLLMLANTAFGAYEWREGDGTNTITGATVASDIDSASFQNIVDPLDRLLSKYNTTRLKYTSATSITVQAGQVTCSNADGSVRRMRSLASDLALTWANIDTGLEANSTTYYVWLVADADSTEYTGVISANATTPVGVTYYKRVGSFYNDASGNITRLTQDGYYSNLGSWVSRTINVTYLAETDGFVMAYTTGTTIQGLTDSSSSPTTIRAIDGSATTWACVTFPVKAGDYYKAKETGTVYWIPYE